MKKIGDMCVTFRLLTLAATVFTLNLVAADPNQTDVPVTLTNNVRVVQTPHYAPDVMATMLVVEINGNKVER